MHHKHISMLNRFSWLNWYVWNLENKYFTSLAWAVLKLFCYHYSSKNFRSSQAHSNFTLSFIFSLDVRGKPLNQASHWAESSSLGRRTSFRTQSVPNSLLVEDLSLQVHTVCALFPLSMNCFQIITRGFQTKSLLSKGPYKF